MDTLVVPPCPHLSPVWTRSCGSRPALGIIHEAAEQQAADLPSAAAAAALDAEPLSPGAKSGAVSPPADVWSLQIRHFTDCVPVDSFPLSLSSSDVCDSEICEPTTSGAAAAAAEASAALCRANCSSSSSSAGLGCSTPGQHKGEETAEERVSRWLMEHSAPESSGRGSQQSLGQAAAVAAAAEDGCHMDAPDWWQEEVLARWKQQREQVSNSWWLQAKLWAEWAAFKAVSGVIG